MARDLPASNLAKRMRNAKIKANIPWPHDCLRHSFASYHLAMWKSPDQTAHEMGHRSTAMLYAHYRELVTVEDAAAFWSVSPTGNDDNQQREP